MEYYIVAPSTEGLGQARERERESIGVQQGSWQTTTTNRPTQLQHHCNTQELGLAILGIPSTKPTSDLDVQVALLSQRSRAMLCVCQYIVNVNSTKRRVESFIVSYIRYRFITAWS